MNEYLYFKQDSNYAIGFEVFDVTKRDYDMRFGTLDYKNVVGSVNFYYRNYSFIPFDAKISAGEYLDVPKNGKYSIATPISLSLLLPISNK